MEGLTMEDATKIRKRGSSPSSSTSSVIQNYKFKRAILAGKRGGSSTPVPTWRIVGSRSPSVVLRAAAAVAASPRYPPSMSGRSREAHGQPPVSARKLAATLWELNEVPGAVTEEGLREKRMGRREKVRRSQTVHPTSLPHLSDPSHSPVSERREQSGSGSHRRREKSLSRRMKMDTFDSASNASFMEIETRSRCQTTLGSTIGVKTRLKDISSALTTSKELLKIITRMWGNEDQPSSSMSLISASHAELERARLQINQLIQEERSDHKEINLLLKQFSEEKAAWKYKVLSITEELEVERKLRRRFESLNKKLGKELAYIKASSLNAENQMKLLGAKYQFEGKNDAFDQLRNGFETELGYLYRRRDGDLAFYQSKAIQSDREEEADNSNDDGGKSIESDLKSIEFNMDDHHSNRKYQLPYASRHSTDEELKGRKSVVSQVGRRSISLLRSMSGVFEWGNGSKYEVEKQVARRSCGDKMQGYRLAKGLRDHMLPSSRLRLERILESPSSQLDQPWPSRDPCDVAMQRHMTMEGNGTRVRLEDDRAEGHNLRRSRR